MLNWTARRLLPGVLTLTMLLGLAAPARAGLFEDDEARKAILDLRTKVQESEKAAKERSDQLAEQLGTARRGLLDLANQLDALRAEIAKLRGSNEQLARDLADTQRRLADQQQSVEARLRPLEPQKVTLDGKEFLVDPEERRQYDAAVALIRKGEFDDAANNFTAFLKRWGSGGYAAMARFWQGNALYGARDYKAAVSAFRSFVSDHAEHPRAPEALLSLANCQAELKDNKAARRTLEELIKSYPNSESTKAARERLKSLR
ncbi:tol-pal system protein YbgF [Roseateles sp. BYS180W]|uniref:Cell division coordinator CpoB n=1 Tax=Roseateles rivi TaxID=3299028 RepID=A0ABW7FUW6_9BURK